MERRAIFPKAESHFSDCAIDQLAERAARLAPRGPLVIGFSGGSDSLALLAALASLSRAGPRPLHAIIIDHGLRAESASEARRAAQMAAGLGARVEIRRWPSPRPGQAAARAARHGLLAEVARALGACRLFLAHTLDDQRETVAMRARRTEDRRALAGMAELAPSPAWPEGRGLLLARPALGLTRKALRAALSAAGLCNWIEDRSNADRRYERVRVRQRLAAYSADALARLDEIAQTARAHEDAVRRDARRILAEAALPRPWGGFALKAQPFADAPDKPAQRAMEALIIAASGRPGARAARAAVVFVKALLGGRAASGAGAGLTPAGLIGRDPGAATGRRDGVPGAPALRLAPGEAGVFAGRFEIAAPRAAGLEARAWASRAGAGAVGAVPAALRPGLCAFSRLGRDERFIAGLTKPDLSTLDDGAPNAEGRVRWLGPELLARALFQADHVGAFDAACALGG